MQLNSHRWIYALLPLFRRDFFTMNTDKLSQISKGSSILQFLPPFLRISAIE